MFKNQNPRLTPGVGFYYNRNMKKIILFTVLAGLAACATQRPRLVGNDRDEHGCIGSAGYSWSESLHECVRPWEVNK